MKATARSRVAEQARLRNPWRGDGQMHTFKSHRGCERLERPGRHKGMRRAGVWLIVALLGASLAGAASAQSVKNPDTFVIMRISPPDSLDPAWADDIYSREPIAYMVYEPLIFFDGGSTSRYIPM